MARRLTSDPTRPGERGTGLIGSMAAILAFLGFLFFAVQLLTNLYATSVVTANAFDAARSVASAQADSGSESGAAAARAAAEADVRARMGATGDRLRFDWSGSDDDVVRLHVIADNRRLPLFGIAPLPYTHIDRTIEVRVERFR